MHKERRYEILKAIDILKHAVEEDTTLEIPIKAGQLFRNEEWGNTTLHVLVVDRHNEGKPTYTLIVLEAKNSPELKYHVFAEAVNLPEAAMRYRLIKNGFYPVDHA